MTRLVASRLLSFGLTLWMTLTLVFLLMRLVPGDPISTLRGEAAGEFPAQAIQSLRSRHGLDRTTWSQYYSFMKELVTSGSLGESYVNGRPVTQNLLAAWPYTAALAGAAMLVSLLMGIPAGILAGYRRGGWSDRLLTSVSVTGISLPYFVTGLGLLYLFAFRWPWFPLGGASQAGSIVLPALSLGIVGAARLARFVRGLTADILQEDFVRTARAKGLREYHVLRRHALPNILIPLITVIGLQFGLFLAGSVITESVFSWPGLGDLMVRSILQRDYSMVQGAALLFAATIAALNLAADILHSCADPRLRSAAKPST